MYLLFLFYIIFQYYIFIITNRISCIFNIKSLFLHFKYVKNVLKVLIFKTGFLNVCKKYMYLCNIYFIKILCTKGNKIYQSFIKLFYIYYI